MTITLDATYSLGENLSGVGVYSRELLRALAARHAEQNFELCYRPHRYLRSFSERLAANCRRSMLYEPFFPRSRDFFHGLNQRLPGMRFRRTVATFHDLFVLTGDYSTPEFRRRFAGQARKAAAESDVIIAVSEFTAGQVEQLLGVERARLHVVPHGSDHLPLHPAPRRENVILNVGAIQKRKNIVVLLEAFEQTAPGWKLVLAGSRGYGAEQILTRISSSPRRRDIQVLGYLSAVELAQWYSRARIFAFPSLDEGFGLPVLEAMAAGVPVVASNRSALPEVCGDAGLVVDPDSAEGLHGALERLMRDQDLARRLVERGLARAAEFTWERAADKTWKIYQTLLA